MDPLEALPVGVSPAKEGGSDISDFGDVFGAAFENMFVADQSTSREYNTIQARGALFKEAAEAVGMSVTDWRKMIYAQEIPELAQIGPTKLAEDMASRNMPMQDLVRIDRWRRNLPAEVRAKVPDPNDFDLYSKRLALETYFRNEGIISSASGFDRTVGSFTGGTAGSMFDPINLGSMAIFRRPSTSIVGGLTYGAATSGATELILQPFVQQYREELGLPSGWDEGLQNVLFATIGGGAFGGIEGGVSKLGEYLSTRLAKGVATDTERDLYDLVSRRQNGDIDEAEFFTELQSLRSQDDALDAALSISERAEAARDVDESNPFGSVPDADELHRARFQSPELADLEAVDAPLVDGSFIMSDPRLRELGIEAVDFRTLLRDPERFQFKASDEDGLTGALSDVTAWEPERAGLLLVWEDEAGHPPLLGVVALHACSSRSALWVLGFLVAALGVDRVVGEQHHPGPQDDRGCQSAHH